MATSWGCGFIAAGVGSQRIIMSDGAHGQLKSHRYFHGWSDIDINNGGGSHVCTRIRRSLHSSNQTNVIPPLWASPKQHSGYKRESSRTQIPCRQTTCQCIARDEAPYSWSVHRYTRDSRCWSSRMEVGTKERTHDACCSRGLGQAMARSTSRFQRK